MLKKNNVLFFILSIFLSILVVFSGISPVYVSADSSVAGIEKTNVLDDLKDMTIDGKKFSLEDYNFDTKKDTQILSFVEYCYSFYEEKQDDFGLYLYVYNPKGLKFNTESFLNTIQFATTKDKGSSYVKYRLHFLNKSEKTDCVGLFYKFKVVLTDFQKNSILNGVNRSMRIYNVSGFELLNQGDLNATDYSVALRYSYSGYAKGYGPNVNAVSTLTCLEEDLITLSLDVYQTSYIPDGTNGKNDYTHDSLHSVYFAVPNEVIQQYGEMVAVHATWLNAVLKPALVTGNQDAYNIFSKYLGVSNSEYNLSVDYMYVGADMTEQVFDKTYHYYGYLLNRVLTSQTHSFALRHKYVGNEIKTLYSIYNSGKETDSADDFLVSSDSIRLSLEESADKFGGNLVNGKYSEYMFESVDDEFTEVNYRADKTWPLNSEHKVLDKAWWETLLGLSGEIVTEYSTTFDGIQAIYPVKDIDISGTPEEVSNRLFISKSDVQDFKDYYDDNKKNSTVYLFRYQVSDYISQEASLYKFRSDNDIYRVDTNAYFFQGTVNLDFDVIDITLSTGKVETVIPIVSNPIDVIPEAPPPAITESDKDKNDILDMIKLILGLLLLGFIVYILASTGLLKVIVDLLLWIIKAPFKFVKWLIDKFTGS